jgi:hypothetical protein
MFLRRRVPIRRITGGVGSFLTTRATASVATPSPRKTPRCLQERCASNCYAVAVALVQHFPRAPHCSGPGSNGLLTGVEEMDIHQAGLVWHDAERRLAEAPTDPERIAAAEAARDEWFRVDDAAKAGRAGVNPRSVPGPVVSRPAYSDSGETDRTPRAPMASLRLRLRRLRPPSAQPQPSSALPFSDEKQRVRSVE